MIPILQFIFQDFWHFLGSMILLGIVVSPFQYLFGRRDSSD